MGVGIEAINVYAGRTSLDVATLFDARGLDMRRFGNLMMHQKSVNLPCEDAVSNAVNAAKPLLDELSPADLDSIETVVIGTESGLDFGKPISTYIHHYLQLPRGCRSFEVKHACYGGTAALQTAAAMVAAAPYPGTKALVIAADAASVADRNTYWEPSQGAGAVAMIVGNEPGIMELDLGANGFCSYEVMDTLRPRPDLEAGDSDLSLLSYLHCLEQSYQMYAERVSDCDLATTFDCLVFHTPFAGMVKGAHRTLMRKTLRAAVSEIEADFRARLEPSLQYCMRVGNVYSAALYLALCSMIDHSAASGPRRFGMFSYGSGCASEFYSGVVPAEATQRLQARGISQALDARVELAMDEYEIISDLSVHRMAGVQDYRFDTAVYDAVYEKAMAGQDLLVLDEIRDFHRVYRWS